MKIDITSVLFPLSLSKFILNSKRKEAPVMLILIERLPLALLTVRLAGSQCFHIQLWYNQMKSIGLCARSLFQRALEFCFALGRGKVSLVPKTKEVITPQIRAQYSS